MLQGYGTHTMNKRNEQRHTRRWEVLQYLNVWGLFRFAQGGGKSSKTDEDNKKIQSQGTLQTH